MPEAAQTSLSWLNFQEPPELLETDHAPAADAPPSMLSTTCILKLTQICLQFAGYFVPQYGLLILSVKLSIVNRYA